jgi:hypothetical protein
VFSRFGNSKLVKKLLSFTVAFSLVIPSLFGNNSEAKQANKYSKEAGSIIARERKAIGRLIAKEGEKTISECCYLKLEEMQVKKSGGFFRFVGNAFLTLAGAFSCFWVLENANVLAVRDDRTLCRKISNVRNEEVILSGCLGFGNVSEPQNGLIGLYSGLLKDTKFEFFAINSVDGLFGAALISLGIGIAARSVAYVIKKINKNSLESKYERGAKSQL